MYVEVEKSKFKNLVMYKAEWKGEALLCIRLETCTVNICQGDNKLLSMLGYHQLELKLEPFFAL